MGAPPRPRRTRRGKKRVVFQPPQRFAVPVRTLWKTASPEEQRRAHRWCAVILEYWLGRITKQGASEKLALPVLRIWQISQMALSGMLAGLLEQPRWRGEDPMPRSSQSREIQALRKENRELQDKLQRTEDLVRLLRDLPLSQAFLPPPGETPSEESPKPRPQKKAAKPPREKKSGRSGAGSQARGAVDREPGAPPKG